MIYTVLGDSADYHVVAFSGFNMNGNSRYISGINTKSRILQLFYRIHISSRVLKGKLPLKKIWFPMYLKGVSKTQTQCFIVLARAYDIFGESLYKYLKKTYKKCKLVYLFQDLVSIHKTQDIQYLKERFDLVVTFDEGDASKYDMLCFPLIYSDIFDNDDVCIKSDVYFVGKAKNRYKKIVETYTELCSLGLKCDFNIIDTPQNEEKVPGINYLDHMSYVENIKHIKQCRCIYETIQQNGISSTLRMNEAIVFEKKLLSDSKSIRESSLYNPDYIYCLEDHCDGEIVEFLNKNVYINFQKYKDSFSPEAFIEFISKKMML